MKHVVTAQPHRSSLGPEAGLLTALLYGICAAVNFSSGSQLLSWLLPLLLIFLEKDSYFIRFHAAQVGVLNLFAFTLKFLLKAVFGLLNSVLAIFFPALVLTAALLNLLLLIINLLLLVLLIVGAIRTYRYRAFCLPLIGGLAEKLLLNVFK